MKTRFALMMVAYTFIANSADNNGKVVTVCELLQNDPAPWNGKSVVIRGYIGFTDEGSWLFDECPNHLTTRGLTWANTVWVQGNATDPDSLRAFAFLSRKLRRLHVDQSRGDSVRVTLVGQLETRASMNDAVVAMPDGRMIRYGFGHLGSAPAAIEVHTIKDIIVERRKPAPRA